MADAFAADDEIEHLGVRPRAVENALAEIIDAGVTPMIDSQPTRRAPRAASRHTFLKHCARAAGALVLPHWFADTARSRTHADVTEPHTEVTTLKSFVVENGRPGAIEA